MSCSDPEWPFSHCGVGLANEIKLGYVHCTLYRYAGWYTKMHLQAFLSEKDVDEKKTLQGMKKMGQLLMWVLPGTGCERLRNT